MTYSLDNFVEPIEQPLELKELKDIVYGKKSIHGKVMPGNLLIEEAHVSKCMLMPPLRVVYGIFLDPPDRMLAMLPHIHNCRTALLTWHGRKEDTVSIHPSISGEATKVGIQAMVDAGLLPHDMREEFEIDLKERSTQDILDHCGRDPLASVATFQNAVLAYGESMPGAIYRHHWVVPQQAEEGMVRIPFVIIGDEVPHMGIMPNNMTSLAEKAFVGLYGFNNSIWS